MEFLSESLEICLESSWSISQWNTQGIPFKINRNWLGELLVYAHMEFYCNSFQNQWKQVWRESIWNSFQNQLKLVWRAPGLCSYGILMEFFSKSMEIGLDSSWSELQWKLVRRESLWNLFTSLRNSFQVQWKFVWRASLWNSVQNQRKLVWRALGQFPRWNP